MSQLFVEIDPLSICDYSLTYQNVNQGINAGNTEENNQVNKTNTENTITYNQFNENNQDSLNNVQSNQINDNNRLESLNDVALTELPKLPDNNVKQEYKDVGYDNDMVKNLMNNLSVNKSNNQSNENKNNVTDSLSTGNIDSDSKPFEKGRRKVKKERSTYWSEKITEKDFPFYGCAVCNICYVDLTELDKHIATHKDRTTSYDLRVKNQLKRKKLKKEKKKLKKLGKEIKKENVLLDIEIKPEDGYIGSEKASDFQNADNEKPFDNDASNSNKERDSNTSNDVKVSNKQSQVENNQELMNLQKIFKCFACQKQFTLSYYLKLHVRSHTDEKPYTCPTCGQSFITASKLGRHNKRFHLQIKFQCRICYRYFSRFECLTTHFDRKHPDDKIEGEPYDYNAILPYLKELEEELKQKSETKPKKEDIWTDGWDGWPGGKGDTEPGRPELKSEPGANQMGGNHFMSQNGIGSTDKGYSGSNDVSLESQEQVVARPIEIILEEIKPDVEVQLEPLEVEVKAETLDQFDDGNFKEESDDDAKVKSESGSDEEYFPDNTWASTKDESPPPADADAAADPLTCRVCKKRISSTSYMKIHMRTHTGERPFKCYVCDAGFITSSKMHRHVLNVHTSAHKEGALDVKKEESTDGEVKPKREPEGADGEVRDPPIKKRMKASKKSKKAGAEKKKKKYQKRPHACEFCNQRFLHLETLEVHKKSHEGQPLVYKCKFCLVDVDDEASLKTHEETHSGPKPYLCTICGKVYKKKETMVYHRKHHKPENVYACAVCSKTFGMKCKYQRHALTHRRERYTLRYECPVCAHMFHTKYHVGMHLATHQREGLIVEQNRNEILAMVLQNARKIPKKDPAGGPDSLLPADERSRVCNICGEVFQHFYYLEEHLKNHASKLAIEDEEKPEDKKHVCQVCNKSFKLHYYLKLHSFTHTKEKPYICQQCGKGFITRGKLKRHLETHAGLKKFQCHVCYKFFTRPSYLRTHVRTIHGTQDYNFRLAQNLGMTYPSQHA